MEMWFVLAATVVGAHGSRVPTYSGFGTPKLSRRRRTTTPFHPAVGGAQRTAMNHFIRTQHRTAANRPSLLNFSKGHGESGETTQTK